MYNTKAYSAASATSPLASTKISRRNTTEHDVQIEILYCGICHSDLHTVRNEWSSIMPTVYPCVPGHEIVGRVTKVGPASRSLSRVIWSGVGCLVDSDHTCPNCQDDLEQLCPNQTLTFNSPDKHLGAPSPMAAIPKVSSSMNTSCCAFPPISILPGSHHSSAPG